ncbi:hypothetical protein GCM10011490_26360 [Pseudoclavibacter endophyticus]|uniref:Tetratricopeptide repeat protein n=1 Tax=Pseudoclavibacter endophyticus TaxID=1778590 RepID=A0A6H9WJB5_9MICO|nr:tetratricopeptide repeat protein [Pseudoclavibacter endophyticus]KAB1646923.1 hypothetical protein F8O04_14465 [Pseudoclavibacter endophyticus]GGA74399.1 hypothetical protein GCM10011490_26360 [Pseudoclavibacter endophyticus]
MRTYDSPADTILPTSRALRERDASGAALRHEDLGSVVVSSDALYFGARSGENGVDGVVVRVPSGAYRVIATVADGTIGRGQLVAVSVLLSGTAEALRGTLPAAAFWHEAPGELPLIAGTEIAVSDAAVRDQYRDPSWPWDGWLREVVDPELAAARGNGRAGIAVAYPGRDDALIMAGPIAGDTALFAGFDEARRPTALHLEALPAVEVAHDAPPPWVTQAPSFAPVDPNAEQPASASVGASDAPFGAAPKGNVPHGEDPLAQSSHGQSPSPFGTPPPSPFGVPPVAFPGVPADHGDQSFRPDVDPDALAGVPDGGHEDAPISATPLGSLTGEQHPVSTDTPPAGKPVTAAHSPRVEQSSEDSPPVFGLRSQAMPPAPTSQPARGPESDPVVRLIVSDATSGVEAAERHDTERAIPLLIKVTDALAAGEASRPGVLPALEAASLNGAQLVDSLVDALLTARRGSEAINRLAYALDSSSLRGEGEETVHLRHRLGELQLRAGALEDATATLERARSEADALASTSDPGARDTADAGRNYLAHITYDLATTQLRAGNAGPAAELALDAMRTFEALRVARMAGRGAFLAASAYDQLGHQASRQQAFAEAERIFREGRELDGLGTALGYLGEADALRGDYLPAIIKFEQARAALEEAGELRSAAVAAENEAVCYDYLGRHDEAGELRRSAASLAGRAGATAGA